MDRITHRSSTHSATWGNRLLTGSPLRPYCLKLQGLAERVAVVVELGRLHLHLEGLAAFLLEPRFGIEEGVHLRRPAIAMSARKITLRARARKCSHSGREGLTAGVLADAPKLFSPSKPANASAPKPFAQRANISRRVRGASRERDRNDGFSTWVQLPHSTNHKFPSPFKQDVTQKSPQNPGSSSAPTGGARRSVSRTLFPDKGQRRLRRVLLAAAGGRESRPDTFPERATRGNRGRAGQDPARPRLRLTDCERVSSSESTTTRERSRRCVGRW